jgi:hypothetical protein
MILCSCMFHTCVRVCVGVCVWASVRVCVCACVRVRVWVTRIEVAAATAVHLDGCKRVYICCICVILLCTPLSSTQYGGPYLPLYPAGSHLPCSR